jgi:hypothetical protein
MLKTLIWDIEIVATLNEGLIDRLYTGFLRPGMLMSANMSHMLMFGYKWLHEDKVHCKTIADFPDFKKDVQDDKALCEFASKIISQADHLVAHYGDRFDRKYLDTRLLMHGVHMLPNNKVLRQTDTCKVAKQHLKLDSNRLDVIAKTLGLTPKMHKKWPDWWLRSLKGEKKAIKEMAFYCKQDVLTLEEVYQKIGHLDRQHPSKAALHDGIVCNFCESTKVQARGRNVTVTGIYKRYQCQDCGKWLSDRKQNHITPIR